MATPGPIAHHLYHGEDHPPILLGAAWYPELWDRDVWKRDIELMLEAGLNCVRIAEFAWAFMEPKAGEYAWDWLHDAVAVARDAGLSTILCTPTATPPAWMSRQHPEMLQHLHTQPRGMTHGGRRHYSPHSDIYRDHCRRICEVMGSEFKNEAGVIAWQIDNEVSGGGEFDVSDAARTAFHAWLEDRYQTIQNLNNTWNTGVWSQTYSAFDHVPLPTSGPGGGGTTHHPVLRFHFYRFTAEAWASFIRLQAEVLRRYVSQPITTNMIPYQGSDQHAVVDDLDFLSIDTYYQTDDDELHGNVWEMDWMRSAMPERNPWVMETWSTYNGGNVVGFGLQPEGAMRANAWTHVAAGAEAVLFWLWRGAPRRAGNAARLAGLRLGRPHLRPRRVPPPRRRPAEGCGSAAGAPRDARPGGGDARLGRTTFRLWPSRGTPGSPASSPPGRSSAICTIDHYLKNTFTAR